MSARKASSARLDADLLAELVTAVSAYGLESFRAGMRPVPAAAEAESPFGDVLDVIARVADAGGVDRVDMHRAIRRRREQREAL